MAIETMIGIIIFLFLGILFGFIIAWVFSKLHNRRIKKKYLKLKKKEPKKEIKEVNEVIEIKEDGEKNNLGTDSGITDFFEHRDFY